MSRFTRDKWGRLSTQAERRAEAILARLGQQAFSANEMDRADKLADALDRLHRRFERRGGRSNPKRVDYDVYGQEIPYAEEASDVPDVIPRPSRRKSVVGRKRASPFTMEESKLAQEAMASGMLWGRGAGKHREQIATYYERDILPQIKDPIARAKAEAFVEKLKRRGNSPATEAELASFRRSARSQAAAMLRAVRGKPGARKALRKLQQLQGELQSLRRNARKNSQATEELKRLAKLDAYEVAYEGKPAWYSHLSRRTIPKKKALRSALGALKSRSSGVTLTELRKALRQNSYDVELDGKKFGVPFKYKKSATKLMSLLRKIHPGKPVQITRFDRRDNPTLLVATNPGLTRPYVPSTADVSPRVAKLMRRFGRDPRFKAALKKYVELQGVYPLDIKRVDDAPPGAPKFLVAIGKAPDVAYEAPSHSPKRGTPFSHRWDVKPFLAVSADDRFLGYVGRGRGYKVTNWMYG